MLKEEEDDDHLLDDHTVVNIDKITNNSNSKISNLRNQVNGVVDDMKINIEKVVERGSNLDELNDRSEQMGNSADMFSKRSKGLRRNMYFRTCRARMYLGITVSFIVLLIICKFILIYNEKRIVVFEVNLRRINLFFSFY